MALSDRERLYLRTLWEETGGDHDTIHEFWQEVRRRGLRISYPKVAFFLRTEPMSENVRGRVAELWADHESTAEDLLRRAKAAKIPLTSEQASKFVREQPARASERFLEPRRDGKSFAYDPRSEWKMDVVYMPEANGFKYIVLRINSFTRELDGEAAYGLDDEAIQGAVRELLDGVEPPRVVLTDGGREFGACEQLFRERGIFHEVKEQGDYGAFAILDGSIAKLKRLLRVEGTEKGRPWPSQLARVLRILNQRPNKSLGVSPASVTVDEEPTAKEKEKAELGQFRIYEHMSQNILHNIALHKKQAAVLKEKGGARIRLPKERVEGEDADPERKRGGPKRRADDPKFGNTERLLDNDFKDGRVYTEAGTWTNMKLVVPSVPEPPQAGGTLSAEERGYLEGLFAHVLDKGPQPLREANSFLAESGMDLRALLSRFTFRRALQHYSPAFKIYRSVLYLEGAFTYKGLKCRVRQSPTLHRGPRTPRVDFEGTESGLSRETVLGLMGTIEGTPPKGWALVRRVADLVDQHERGPRDPPAEAPTEDGPPSTLLADRPEWQVQHMKVAWREGWRYNAPVTEENDKFIRELRAALTGWEPPEGRRHWCPRCRDRGWCRRDKCGGEGYRPRGARFVATRLTFEGMYADDIETVIEFIESDAPRSDADAASLYKFGETVWIALREAGVVADEVTDEMGSFSLEGLRENLTAVHAALEKIPEEHVGGILTAITRVIRGG